MAGNISDNYDFQQIIKKVYEEPNVPDSENPNLLRVRNIGGSLVPDICDEVAITSYVSGGTANNEPESLSCYYQSNLVATIMFEYYPDGKFKRAYRV